MKGVIIMAKHIVKQLHSGIYGIFRIDPISGKRKEVGRSKTREKAEYSAKARTESAVKCHS
jgi:hypothetical protein